MPTTSLNLDTTVATLAVLIKEGLAKRVLLLVEAPYHREVLWSKLKTRLAAGRPIREYENLYRIGDSWIHIALPADGDSLRGHQFDFMASLTTLKFVDDGGWADLKAAWHRTSEIALSCLRLAPAIHFSIEPPANMIPKTSTTQLLGKFTISQGDRQCIYGGTVDRGIHIDLDCPEEHLPSIILALQQALSMLERRMLPPSPVFFHETRDIPGEAK